MENKKINSLEQLGHLIMRNKKLKVITEWANNSKL